MAKAKYHQDGGHIYWMCPGCGHFHGIPVGPKDAPECWGFNGDLEKPTITPSVKNTLEAKYSVDNQDHICHCVITDGKITFVGDSTHHLSGQVVDMVEMK